MTRTASFSRQRTSTVAAFMLLLLLRVFLASCVDGRDHAGHACCWPFRVRRLRIPCAGDGLLDSLGWSIDRSQERPVRSVRTVVRLPRGVLEISCDKIGPHAMQNGAMKEQCVPGSSLCVAGNLPVPDCEVANPLEARGRLPLTKRCGYPFQDKSVGGANTRKVRMPFERQHKGIGETTWALQDGPAAARASKDRQAVLFAGGKIDIVGHARGAT